MQSGDTSKTINYTLHYWWDSAGHSRDLTLGNSVGCWVGKNERALDKKKSAEVVKLMAEQFPFLVDIEVRHCQLQHARIRR